MAYRRAEYRLVVNYGVLTTGIDEDVRIIGICRIIKSETDWVQIIGRGLRTDNPRKRVAGLGPKTDVLVIDHGGNLTRDDGTALAPAEDIYHDHLDMHDPADKKAKAFDEDPKPATHRKCKKCGWLIPPKTKKCPACGDDSLPAYNGSHVEAEFSEFNGQKTKKPKKVEATMFEKQDFYSGLLTLMDQRGKTKEWDLRKCESQASQRYRDKFKVWPNQLHKQRGHVSLEVQMFDKHARIKFAKSKAKEGVTA